ncbi:MAG: metallophosphoesterase [Burkholderiales bacterium]
MHTLLIAGDIADCQFRPASLSGAAKTAPLVEAALHSAAGNSSVITLGDHTYPDGAAQEFDDCYSPSWGRFKNITHPSPGNHDYNTPLAAGYYDYFADRAGPARRGYYSYDIAGWHIVSLNSNIDAAMDSAQMQWLRDDLAASKALCTIAYWHHPLFTSGMRGNFGQMKTAWKILHNAGADVVLSAHDHHYERFAPQDAEGNTDTTQGIREFMVGTGGANLSRIMENPRLNSEARDNSSHGILRLELAQGKYRWDFLPVSGGNYRDSGIGSCH